MPTNIVDILYENDLYSSASSARRAILNNQIMVNEILITDPNFTMDWEKISSIKAGGKTIRRSPLRKVMRELTPEQLFRKLNKEFMFTAELFADHINTRCGTIIERPHYETWTARCWMDSEKAPTQHRKRSCEQVWARMAHDRREETLTVALLPVRTHTRWWHEYCLSEEVRFIEGRYRGSEPKAIVVFGSETPGMFSFKQEI